MSRDIEGYDDYHERVARGLPGYTWEGLIGRIDQLYKEVEEANARLSALDFRPGDAMRLGFVLSGEYERDGCKCEKCAEATDMLRRLADMARQMEKEDEKR